MNHIPVIIIVTILLIVGEFSHSAMGQTDAEKQAIQAALIENERMERTRFFKEDPGSPLSREQKQNFGQLNYFPHDPDYKVFARISRDEEQQAIQLQMSDKSNVDIIKYGTVTFSLKGNVVSLTVFRDQNLPELAETPGQLFIPFTDLTNGDETGRAGRYIMLDNPADEINFMLDFNKAINPYHAYNNQYNSLLPPPENVIPLKVKAGEKKYETGQR